MKKKLSKFISVAAFIAILVGAFAFIKKESEPKKFTTTAYTTIGGQPICYTNINASTPSHTTAWGVFVDVNYFNGAEIDHYFFIIPAFRTFYTAQFDQGYCEFEVTSTIVTSEGAWGGNLTEMPGYDSATHYKIIK